jgi:adenosylmethionine-8-amino-7-oxononanoate aminotransferase
VAPPGAQDCETVLSERTTHVSDAELLAADRRHVWHPYAPIDDPQAPLPVAGASGVRLRLRDGRELIDGMSSWWCAIHGYRHPVIDAAVREQLEEMAHVMLGGLTHEPVVALATRLAGLAPKGLEQVFFADSGSVAVEVAIKLCLQYQRGVGRPRRRRLITVRGGYHGDTLGAMSLCDPVDGMHSQFVGTVAAQVFADRPPAGYRSPLDPAYAAHLADVVCAHAEEAAAILVEPVVQGAGGMRFHSPEIVSLLRDLCDEHGLLLVLDEIATGFGRTGELWAADHAGVTPDVMCVGKALTGGYMSLAATLCAPHVGHAIDAGETGAFLHGPTFMGNPLACAAALASLELLDSGSWRADVARIEQRLAAGLAPARDLPGVEDVRVLGAIGVVALDRPADVARVTRTAVQHGVWLRPFRDLIYTMPPYITADADLERITAAIVAAAHAGDKGS